MTEIVSTASSCVARIREILAQARNRALQSVNTTMLAAYREIGREIVEEQQRGQNRAQYGSQLIAHISERLTAEHGKGFSEANLRQIRRLYVTYRDRQPAIRYTPSTELPGPALPATVAEIPYTPSTKSDSEPAAPLSERLSWSHYRLLMRVDRDEARSFYEEDVPCQFA